MAVESWEDASTEIRSSKKIKAVFMIPIFNAALFKTNRNCGLSIRNLSTQHAENQAKQGDGEAQSEGGGNKRVFGS
ncbi:hypothetical protein B0E43_13290 [Algoriphagus sp. A40]|nr:hypothetical protein B0E43_13290 [Algoriphagus sp. A40]